MSLLEQYQAKIEQGIIVEDLRQKDIIKVLDSWILSVKEAQSSWFGRKHAKGIYLYGDVGAGRTWLMDFCAEQFPHGTVTRMHFHGFMEWVFGKLRNLQGQSSPLKKVAKMLSHSTKMLFLDEFMVHDVTHALILVELLEALLDEKIVLFFTSNIAPDNLYLNGINRNRFLKAIALIKENCIILQLDRTIDHRLGKNPSFAAWYLVNTPDLHDILRKQFVLLSHVYEESGEITVLHRPINYEMKGARTIWFTFQNICRLPRAQQDYLVLSTTFFTFFITDIPKFDKKNTTELLLFMQLIDILYGKKIRIVISTELPLDEMFKEADNPSSGRTLSRL